MGCIIVAISDGKYAIVVKTRMQVNGFTDYPEAVNKELAYLIDLQEHPQKDEVQEEWFYDPATEKFSPEGEISYPEIIQEPPTAEELYRAANLLNQAEILANQRQQDKVMAAILLEQVGGEANV